MAVNTPSGNFSQLLSNYFKQKPFPIKHMRLEKGSLTEKTWMCVPIISCVEACGKWLVLTSLSFFISKMKINILPS